MSRAPHECRDMTELRAEIDRLDDELIRLLAARAGYIKRAVEIKHATNLPAYIPERVAQVMQNVKASAERNGADPALVEGLWRALVDWSCRYEKEKLGQ